MVKGVSRQVVSVKSPDPKCFEEALFFVRDDALRHYSSDELLQEAQALAQQYLRRPLPARGRVHILPLAAAFLSGAGLASLCCLLVF